MKISHFCCKQKWMYCRYINYRTQKILVIDLIFKFNKKLIFNYFKISFRNIIVCKQTIIEISRLRSRWRVGSFSLQSNMTWNIFLYNIFIITILLNYFYFLTDIYIFLVFFEVCLLLTLSIKTKRSPYTSSRPKWVKRMKRRDLILLL